MERTRTMQAPNRATAWSGMQNAREVAMAGPRFEQTVLEAQVRYVCSHMYGYNIYISCYCYYPISISTFISIEA